jgi:hypothetical protein
MQNTPAVVETICVYLKYGKRMELQFLLIF